MRGRLGLGVVALALLSACGGGAASEGVNDAEVAAASVTTGPVAPEVTSPPGIGPAADAAAPTTTTAAPPTTAAAAPTPTAPPATTTPPPPPSTTARPAPPVTQALVAAPATTPPTTAQPSGGNCHPAYPGDCIPPAPPDLDCPDVARKVRVDHAHGDPHGFDRDGDGFGCDSYG